MSKKKWNKVSLNWPNRWLEMLDHLKDGPVTSNLDKKKKN